MRLGLNVRIDVTKIDKSRLYEGKNGAKYLDLTTFVNTGEPDKYGNHGFVTEQQTQEERQNGVRMPILGNTRVFWQSESDRESSQAQEGGGDISDDNIPF